MRVWGHCARPFAETRPVRWLNPGFPGCNESEREGIVSSMQGCSHRPLSYKRVGRGAISSACVTHDQGGARCLTGRRLEPVRSSVRTESRLRCASARRGPQHQQGAVDPVLGRAMWPDLQKAAVAFPVRCRDFSVRRIVGLTPSFFRALHLHRESQQKNKIAACKLALLCLLDR